LHDHVAKRLESSENHLIELERLTEAVLDRSVLIHAHCDAGFDSFVVFSTLNATGLQLTATQILRARSLGLVANLPRSVGDETKQAWDAIEQLGDDGDRFLQAFLVLRTGERIQEKDIVRKFDQTVLRLEGPASGTELEAHFATLARELKRLVPMYEDLAAGTWPATHPVPDEWRANRLSLLVKTLKVRQLLPLLMSAASRKSLDFGDVLEVLERASFVALVCFDNQTRWGDRSFQLAAALYGSELSFDAFLESVQDFFKVQLVNPAERLAARLPERLRYHGNRKTLIRYFLTTINDWGFPASPPADDPDIQATWVLRDIHIDHISAQNGADPLSKLDRDRLGNLTPLKGRENSSLSNKPFDQKTAIYAGSPLRITRALKDLPDWTAEAVSDRERAMVEFAVELFCRDLPPIIRMDEGDEHPWVDAP
jgi:hypothetical protein